MTVYATRHTSNPATILWPQCNLIFKGDDRGMEMAKQLLCAADRGRGGP